MITPLDIENKKFSKQMVNGYSVDEIDDFLDQLTLDYEKMYKENIESRNKIEELNNSLEHYKSIENTLQGTLLMAQTTAEEVKNVARQQAEQILNEAQASAKEAVGTLDNEIAMKKNITKRLNVYYNCVNTIDLFKI